MIKSAINLVDLPFLTKTTYTHESHMASRQGGKLKPLKVCINIHDNLVCLLIIVKAPKKDKKDEDEEDLAFKKRKQEEAAAIKAAKEKGAWFTSMLPLLKLTHYTALKGLYRRYVSTVHMRLILRWQEELLVAVSRSE